MTEKIAIHVPNQWLSEAVQRKLFDMGYGWGREKVQRICDTSNREEPCINISDNDKAIFFDGKSHFDKSYTILSVDEFFKREAEKEKRVTVGSWGKAQAAGNGFVIYNRGGLVIMDITWEELEAIRALRPKEGE